MERERSVANIDESLAMRVATFTRGSQRWLKTALQAIATSDLAAGDAGPSVDETQLFADEPVTIAESPATEAAASLEDVITGKADLRDHLESYPELQDELEGLADVIDLLREAGETRRRRGEQILREEILGEQAPEDTDAEDELA